MDATSSGAKLYPCAINNLAIPAFKHFRQSGYKPYTLAFCWCQGERDCQDSACASRYQYELVRLLNKFKDDMRNSDH